MTDPRNHKLGIYPKTKTPEIDEPLLHTVAKQIYPDGPAMVERLKAGIAELKAENLDKAIRTALSSHTFHIQSEIVNEAICDSGEMIAGHFINSDLLEAASLQWELITEYMTSDAKSAIAYLTNTQIYHLFEDKTGECVALHDDVPAVIETMTGAEIRECLSK